MITFVAIGLSVGIVIAYFIGALLPLWAYYAAIAVALGVLALSYRLCRFGIAALLLTCATVGALVMTLDMRSNGSFAHTYNINKEETRYQSQRRDNTEIGMVQQRKALAEKFRQSGELEDDEYAIVTAMTLGEKQNISRELKQVYSISGASHVFALSGLHVSILFGLLMFLLPSRRHPAISSLVATVILWGYVALIGAQPSLLRATVMLTCYALCLVIGQNTDSLSKLCLAATIMLLAKPQWLFDISFQMSFAAVFGIATCYSPLRNILSLSQADFLRPPIIIYIKKSELWLWSLTVLSLSAQLFTLPLIVHYFGRISVYSLLANLIVSPLATLIVGTALLTLILTFLASPLPVIGSALSFMEHPMRWSATLLQHLTHYMNTTLTNIAVLPGSHLDGLQVSIPETVCVYVIIFAVVFYIKDFCPWTKRQ